MARILVVDDEPRMTSLVCGELEDQGYRVTTTTSGTEALELMKKHSFDLVITDLSMPDVSGMKVLEAALEKEGTAVVMMTAFGTVKTAVAAMKKGASDYLTKPFELEELTILVKRIIDQQKLNSLSEHYAQEIKKAGSAELIGGSPAAEKVRKMIKQVAGTEATVMLTGKSGTGKELAARMIHEGSARAAQPFIAINCAAIPETLLESELFGHEKGAFTGATGRKQGRFELADQGTIFLDEIGEMPMSMQSKLLRVLEEKQVTRVGGVDPIDIDVRVISATNRNPKDEVADGRFREDLYFRLNVFPIDLPTLAERGADVVELAEYFLAVQGFAHPKLDREVKGLLQKYDWPGNVRELKNVLERAVILSGGEPLTVEEFSLDVDNAPIGFGAREHGGPSGGLVEEERAMILKALEQAEGNKTEAARLLKITRRRLYSRMKVHRLK